MGQRHLFGTPQMFDTDHDTGWNHLEQPYAHLGRSGATENGPSVRPSENMSLDVSNWNPASQSDGYSPLSHNIEVQRHNLEVSASSNDLFLHPSGAENLSMALENYPQHVSSSNYGNNIGQIFPGVEGGLCDLSIGNGRGPYKRKIPGVPVIHERGSTSRYYEAGSSSDLSMTSDYWQEKPNIETHQTPQDSHNITPNYRSNVLSIGSEGTRRNVRSRRALHFGTNLASTQLLSNPSLPSYPIAHLPDSNNSSVDRLGQSSTRSITEWGYAFNSSNTYDRRLVSDTAVFNHEANHSVSGSSNPSSVPETGGYHNDFILNRNPIPQNLQGDSTIPVRGVRGSSTQRSTPAFRNLSSNFCAEHVVTSNEGLQLASDNYSSRHLRQFPGVGWHNSDCNGQTRISRVRFRPFPRTFANDRLTTEGLIIADRSGFFASGNFDQHRDMRLDVDNMSYEELLALGERIGNVSTGLSEDLLSTCLTESIYCSSDQFQEDSTCVICMDEFKNMDDVGVLKACGHDFHVSCIKKWLSMKNLCPICKASAVSRSDHMK